jgi:hypothetical protein
VSPARRPLGLNVLAAVLILMSSFVHFLTSHRYPLLAPEAMLALLGVIAVAILPAVILSATPCVVGTMTMAFLVTWFIDVNVRHNATSPLLIVASAFMVVPALLAVYALRNHFGLVASVVFGTILVATLALEPGTAIPPRLDAGAPSARSDLPIVVHLILDEHVGLAGISEATEGGRALRTRLQAFYETRGFSTFPRAFSQYFNSRHAIAHALNFKDTFDAALVQRTYGTFAWRMSSNAYMSDLWQRGYRIHVYQPDYMDLCPQSPAAAERCRTYRASSFKTIETATLTTSAKLRVIVSAYLHTSWLYTRSRSFYESVRTGRFGRRFPLPAWAWERSRVYSIAAMSALDAIRADLAEARRGDAFFAHLLIPHLPYVYDRTCTLQRDVSRWVDRSLYEEAEAASTPAGPQAARHTLYFEQVECVTRKLDEMLEVLRARGLLDDAVIIVHGDHGSRITRIEPMPTNLDTLTTSEFTGSFSTLFAIRRPGVPPVDDDHPWALAELLAHFVREDFANAPVKPRGRPAADVYVREDGTETYQAVPSKALWSSVETANR